MDVYYICWDFNWQIGDSQINAQEISFQPKVENKIQEGRNLYNKEYYKPW